MTLQDRLRECFQPVEDAFPQSDGAMLAIEAADALDAKDERIRELEGALRGMIDLAELWINREDTRGMSEGPYNTWLALGHHSNAMKRAREALK